MLNKNSKSEFLGLEFNNNSLELSIRRKKSSVLPSQHRQQTKFKSFLKRIQESPPKNIESEPSPERIISKPIQTQPQSKTISTLFRVYSTIEPDDSSLYPEQSQSKLEVSNARANQRKQKRKNPQIKERQWISKMKEKQVAVKFPQINLVQSALRIQESSIEPCDDFPRRNKIQLKNVNRSRIKSLSNKNVKIESEYSTSNALLQAISKRKIEAWTINNWS